MAVRGGMEYLLKLLQAPTLSEYLKQKKSQILEESTEDPNKLIFWISSILQQIYIGGDWPFIRPLVVPVDSRTPNLTDLLLNNAHLPEVQRFFTLLLTQSPRKGEDGTDEAWKMLIIGKMMTFFTRKKKLIENESYHLGLLFCNFSEISEKNSDDLDDGEIDGIIKNSISTVEEWRSLFMQKLMVSPIGFEAFFGELLKNFSNPVWCRDLCPLLGMICSQLTPNLQKTAGTLLDSMLPVLSGHLTAKGPRSLLLSTLHTYLHRLHCSGATPNLDHHRVFLDRAFQICREEKNNSVIFNVFVEIVKVISRAVMPEAEVALCMGEEGGLVEVVVRTVVEAENSKEVPQDLPQILEIALALDSCPSLNPLLQEHPQWPYVKQAYQAQRARCQWLCFKQEEVQEMAKERKLGKIFDVDSNFPEKKKIKIFDPVEAVQMAKELEELGDKDGALLLYRDIVENLMDQLKNEVKRTTQLKMDLEQEKKCTQEERRIRLETKKL